MKYDYIGNYKVITAAELPRIAEHRKICGDTLAVCFSVAVEPDDEKYPKSHLFFRTKWKELEQNGAQFTDGEGDFATIDCFTYLYAVRKTEFLNRQEVKKC